MLLLLFCVFFFICFVTHRRSRLFPEHFIWNPEHWGAVLVTSTRKIFIRRCFVLYWPAPKIFRNVQCNQLRQTEDFMTWHWIVCLLILSQWWLAICHANAAMIASHHCTVCVVDEQPSIPFILDIPGMQFNFLKWFITKIFNLTALCV